MSQPEKKLPIRMLKNDFTIEGFNGIDGIIKVVMKDKDKDKDKDDTIMKFKFKPWGNAHTYIFRDNTKPDTPVNRVFQWFI